MPRLRTSDVPAGLVHGVDEDLSALLRELEMLRLDEALDDRWGYDAASDLAKRVWFELGASS